MSSISAPVSRLISRTTRLPHGSPGGSASLLDLLPAPDACAWVRRGEGLVGLGPALRLDFPAENGFAAAARAWQDLTDLAVVRDDVDLPGSGPVAFVSFPFSPGSAATASLIVPSVVVGRRENQSWITTISWDGRLPTAATAEQTDPAPGPGRTRPEPGTLPPRVWTDRVAEAVRMIGGGLDKVVLARDVVVRGEHDFDARWVAGRLAERYENCWTFSVAGLVGATPELLVRSERGLATSRVLAGTIRRTGDDEHDLAQAASLARSSKDLEEHEYAVRSVAEALHPHCDSMNVPESPFVLHLPNVMHLATDVTGVLHRADETGERVAPHASILDLGASLHPTAAVCGTPSDLAAKVIDELEQMDRGRYAGPVGWVDANGDGELGIALRCGQVEDDGAAMRLFAGCGIVAGSQPAEELAESEAKLEPMLQALGSGHLG
ncbi:MAG: isochorismate synthase MenF [Actinomycetales bacterium]